jgi:murein DD-endopeptidase MepM/ murein hydrolase activator NlpD
MRHYGRFALRFSLALMPLMFAACITDNGTGKFDGRTLESPSDDDHADEPDLLYDYAEGVHRGNRGLLFGDGGLTDGGNEQNLDWPLLGEVSSQYGKRRRRFHHGIDIRARTGSRVQCSAPGVVEFAGWQHGYGKVVIVRHRHFKTLYAHLARTRVKPGDRVDRLTELGASGHSGRATGPHLHFEIRTIDGDSVDPLTVIKKDRLISSRH